MDPISLIIGALTAGATAALQDTATQIVKDAYQTLKALLIKKFKGKPSAKMALAEHEKKPEIWQKPLEQALQEVKSEEDQAIIHAAQHLWALTHSESTQIGAINVNITGGVDGAVFGNENKITMNFSEKPKGRKK